jgi:hypothetical protein
MTPNVLAIVVLSSLLAGSPSNQAVRRQATERPDLNRLVEGEDWQIVNRTVTVHRENGAAVARFDERQTEGVAFMRGSSFAAGTIECDFRGQNVFQRSFVGIAFHGLNDSTYDAVYFRPFNFAAEDSARRSHAVQYISHPFNTWSRLRKELPGRYEQPVSPVPDPDKWFHARIVLKEGTVSVFVDRTQSPCLVVKQLSSRKGGWVGFFLGGGAGGEFKNLEITAARESQGRKKDLNK